MHDIYLFGNKKTDQEVVERFKQYKQDLETVEEHISDVTYQDKRKDKN